MGSHYNGIHLGLDYIATLLNHNDHKAIIYNADFYDSLSYPDQKKLLENHDDYKKVLNDLNDPIWKEISYTIKDINPDFIGIQMYTGTFKSAQIVAAIAKELNPEIKIIVGGTHPTIDPMGTIKFDSYDYVVREEGEYAILKIGISIKLSPLFPSHLGQRTHLLSSEKFLYSKSLPYFDDRNTPSDFYQIHNQSLANLYIILYQNMAR